MAFNVDVAKLAEELEFDVEDMEMLLENFLQVSMEYLQALGEAIEANDFEAITHNAHAIKGSAANLRVEGIASLAKEIEMQARVQDRNFDYTATYDKLKQELKDLKDA